jgi:WD40 repeat protein
VYFDHLSVVSGKTVIATQDKQGLHFWDIKNHNLLYTIPERFPFLYFNSEKDYFAIRDRDDTRIIFRNIKDGSIRNKIFISNDHFSVVFSKDWTFIAIEKSEKIEHWDINGNKLREFIEYTPLDSTIESQMVTYDIKFSPDNHLLAAIRYDYENYSIRFWDTRTGNILRDVIVPFRISTMEFSPDGKKLTVLGEGIIYVLGVNEIPITYFILFTPAAE